MKRLFVPMLLAAALALPTQAAAATTKRYSGPVTPSGFVAFKVTQKRHKKAKRVERFNFGFVPVTCADGPHTTVGVVSLPVKLRKTFTINAKNSSGAVAEVHGTVSAGTIHVHGNVPIETGRNGSNCDSGILSWTASRLGPHPV